MKTVLTHTRWSVVMLAVLAGVSWAASLATASGPPPAKLVQTIAGSQDKLVKIYGAGGFRGMEAYQSGILISPEGHILTAWSYVLDSEAITVTLNDGRRFDAKLVGADPRLEVAVLKIDAKDLPFYDLDKSVAADAGTPILALSNLFGVAMGNEPASVQHGAISVLTNLEARHGVFETPYRGPIYVLDVTTNNPGAAGGALINRRGELLGMLGKVLRNSLNNTWLNYAVPIAQVRESVQEIRSGKFAVREDKTPAVKQTRPAQLALLGIVLVPDVLERTPAFVEQVRPGSSAAKAGLRPDDLVLLLGGRLVQSCKALQAELESMSRDDVIKITVLRGQELIELSFEPSGEDR